MKDSKLASVEQCQWRPIEEMHEDDGPCVVIDMEDPGRLAIGHVCDIERDWEEWATHFAKLPRLTEEDADRLIAERAGSPLVVGRELSPQAANEKEANKK